MTFLRRSIVLLVVIVTACSSSTQSEQVVGGEPTTPTSSVAITKTPAPDQGEEHVTPESQAPTTASVADISAAECLQPGPTPSDGELRLIDAFCSSEWAIARTTEEQDFVLFLAGNQNWVIASATSDPTVCRADFVDLGAPEAVLAKAIWACDQFDDESLEYIDERTTNIALTPGDSGNRVRQLQQGLIAVGYLEPGSDDGSFGPNTRRAIIRFRFDNQLGLAGFGDEAAIGLLPHAVPLTRTALRGNGLGTLDFGTPKALVIDEIANLLGEPSHMGAHDEDSAAFAANRALQSNDFVCWDSTLCVEFNSTGDFSAWVLSGPSDKVSSFETAAGFRLGDRVTHSNNLPNVATCSNGAAMEDAGVFIEVESDDPFDTASGNDWGQLGEPATAATNPPPDSIVVGLRSAVGGTPSVVLRDACLPGFRVQIAGPYANFDNFDLRGTGVGTLRFGLFESYASTDIAATLGHPNIDTEWTFTMQDQDYWTTETDPAFAFAYQSARELCWDDFCVFFGGDDPRTRRFVGWHLGGDSFPMSTWHGIGVGTRQSEYPIDLIPVGACFTVAFVDLEGMRVTLKGPDVFYATMGDSVAWREDVEPITVDPDPSLVLVQSMAAGLRPFSLEEDC